MAHPFNEHRAHKVERERVSHIAGKAAGGGTHSDVAADKKLIHHMVKAEALRADGGAVKARADRPARAKGGRVKKHKGTTVNVMVGHPGGVERPAPSVVPPPVVPPPAPAVPPRPPMAPPTGGSPMAGVGMPPPPMRARGGKVDADNVAEGHGRTKVQHTDNMESQRKNIGRGPSITKAKGGGVSGVHGAEFSDGRTGKQMGPKPPGGNGGLKRLWAEKRVK